jgi:hypothetical protein
VTIKTLITVLNVVLTARTSVCSDFQGSLYMGIVLLRSTTLSICPSRRQIRAGYNVGSIVLNSPNGWNLDRKGTCGTIGENGRVESTIED